jgi:4-amino-4-deoxy-L-arabinose transferase-like glycosyltransferase
LSVDEISIAYDAYSVSKTLKDQHNKFLPIAFQSHGTYKAPLEVYLAILPTALLGNNEYSVRFPSAILGSLTVLVIGLFVYELTKNKNLALATSLCLAISPWHIFSSRIALESNVALFFVVLGIYLFFYGKNRKNQRAIILSFISFALSMYGYHTEWGFTPLLVVLLLALYLRKKSFSQKRIFILGVLLFTILIVPLFVNYIQNLGTYARANTELILRNPAFAPNLENPTISLFAKTRTLFNAFYGNYSNYVNPGYLFFNGLGLLPSTDPFQIGFFLFPFLPAFFIGIFAIKKYFKENSLFIYIWTVISPIVPAFTQGENNYTRNLVSIAPFTIIIGVGCLEFLKYLRKRKLIYYTWLLLIATAFLYFLAIYFYHYPRENGENFQYGYKQVALYIKGNYSKYEKIVIDQKFGEGYVYDGAPHLYIPYFVQLPPEYLQASRSDSEGSYFDKFIIKNVNWNKEKPQPKYLYIVPDSNRPPANIAQSLKTLVEIKNPDGKMAFLIYEMPESFGN